MTKPKILSEFEWKILNIIWQNKKASAREVYDVISLSESKAYTTVQTYLERLVEKKFLKKKKIGMVNFYSALSKEHETLEKETRSFVKKAFNNSFTKLAAFLFDSETLQQEDIDAIKEMIAKKEQKNG